MSIEHILTEILNRPLFVTPDKLNVILGVLGKKADNPINLDLSDLVPVIGSDANDGAVQAEARAANNSGAKQIAVIGALGSLVYRTGGNPNAGSGLRSYRFMQQDIQKCLDTNDVDGMIIDFNSYGGSAQGCERMARFIRLADGQKPIYAVVDLNCFSAAYYLAAACRKIILTDQDAGVGSIGCIAIHRDQSQRNEKEGDVYTAVYFGEEKNNFSSHAPLTEETRLKLQRSVDRFGLQFVATVAEFRGISVQAVTATQAGVFYGQDAIDAGLADEIATFDEAVAMLAADVEKDQNKNFYGGAAMTTKERMEKLLTADDGPQALNELGYVKQQDAGEEEKVIAYKQGLAHGNEEKLVQSIEVAELCQLADLSVEQVVAILKEDLSADQARTSIQELRAEKSRKMMVKSNITQLSGDGKHPLISSCEKLVTQA